MTYRKQPVPLLANVPSFAPHLCLQSLALTIAACLLLPAAGSAQILLDDDAPSDPGPNNPLISDPLEDGSVAHPFDTLQEALSAVGSFDTILVKPGRYSGLGNHGLTTGKNFQLRGERGADETIFDCEGTSNFVRVSPGAFFTSFRGIEIRNGLGSGAGAIEILGQSELHVYHCIFRENQATGLGSNGGAITTQGFLNSYWNVFISNKSNGKGGAMAITGNSTNITALSISHCTFRSNEAIADGGAIWFDGFSLSPPLDRSICGSIFWDNETVGGLNDQLGEQNPGNVHMNTSNFQGGWTGSGTGNVNLDPHFLGRNFHLSVTSPMIAQSNNCGVVSSAENLDIDQQSDLDIASDIGADEVLPITFATGTATVGGSVTVFAAGATPAQPVVLLVGFTLADPPIVTAAGELEIADPVPIVLPMNMIGSQGTSTKHLNLGTLSAGTDLVLQAYIDGTLAPATTIQIE